MPKIGVELLLVHAGTLFTKQNGVNVHARLKRVRLPIHIKSKEDAISYIKAAPKRAEPLHHQ